MLAAEFRRRVLAALLCQVQTVFAGNSTPFDNMPHRPYAERPIFDRVCDEQGIEHRFTKPAHPWANGLVERMNRTLKEANVLRYYYETTEQLSEHLQAYDHAKRLKTLCGFTLHEFVYVQPQKTLAILTSDLTQLTLGLYI